jgi:aquaporin Z
MGRGRGNVVDETPSIVVPIVVAEFVGTFFLTLAALLSGSALAVGFTLAVFVYAIGDLSGCALNPAVTVALVTLRRLPLLRGGLYLLAQVLGALLARLVASGIGGLASSYQAGNGWAELFGTAFLIIAVVVVAQERVPKAAGGIVIGLALGAGLLTSKGILNPAIALAMGQGLTVGSWIPLFSGFCFTLLVQRVLTKKAVVHTSKEA